MPENHAWDDHPLLASPSPGVGHQASQLSGMQTPPVRRSASAHNLRSSTFSSPVPPAWAPYQLLISSQLEEESSNRRHTTSYGSNPSSQSIRRSAPKECRRSNEFLSLVDQEFEIQRFLADIAVMSDCCALLPRSQSSGRLQTPRSPEPKSPASADQRYQTPPPRRLRGSCQRAEGDSAPSTPPKQSAACCHASVGVSTRPAADSFVPNTPPRDGGLGSSSSSNHPQPTTPSTADTIVPVRSWRQQEALLSTEGFVELALCRLCGRKFRSDRLGAHEQACSRAKRSQSRPVWNSKEQRCNGLYEWWSDSIGSAEKLDAKGPRLLSGEVPPLPVVRPKSADAASSSRRGYNTKASIAPTTKQTASPSTLGSEGSQAGDSKDIPKPRATSSSHSMRRPAAATASRSTSNHGSKVSATQASGQIKASPQQRRASLGATVRESRRLVVSEEHKAKIDNQHSSIAHDAKPACKAAPQAEEVDQSQHSSRALDSQTATLERLGTPADEGHAIAMASLVEEVHELGQEVDWLVTRQKQLTPCPSASHMQQHHFGDSPQRDYDPMRYTSKPWSTAPTDGVSSLDLVQNAGLPGTQVPDMAGSGTGDSLDHAIGFPEDLKFAMDSLEQDHKFLQDQLRECAEQIRLRRCLAHGEG
mmetsp:Transcript_27470/g.63502  ORF Transcript_27470/g.63502 Transcript_27470/m.63502 type:complete len:646 (+) Transcript_27470:30-1967(+)